MKVRALNEKKWDAENWNGVICMDPDETDKTTNLSKPPLLVKVACPETDWLSFA